METIEYYLKQLPKEVSEKALANTSDERLTLLSKGVSDALSLAFSWDRSKEGHEYWSDVYFNNKN